MRQKPFEIFLDARPIVMSNSSSESGFKDSNDILWYNMLLFPAYLAAASALLLLLHAVLVWGPVRKLYSGSSPLKEDLSEVPFNPSTNFKLEAHVTAHGGVVIFAYKVARMVGCLALLGISSASLILGGKNQSVQPSQNDWLQLALTVSYLYDSVLGLLSVFASARWSVIFSRHLATLLLFTFGVYAYRDVYPLLTYTVGPQDSPDSILWATVTLLAIMSSVIPMVMPRRYVPVDPKNPRESSPEQTASFLSLCFYFFLDPIIWAAWKVPHLPHDQLPPLPDGDFAVNLKNRGFPYLDPTKRPKQRHIFFDLLQVFRWDYILLCISLIVYVCSTFVSPLGVNRLLNYIETRGEGAVVRPWVWIVWLVLGPMSASMAFQWFIFIGTRLVVQTQSLLTQLVFEHSLRIRMKAETSASTPTPETPTAIDATPASDDTLAEESASENNAQSKATDRNATSPSPSSDVASTSTIVNRVPTPEPPKAPEPKPKEHVDAHNLTGKINNLVTTDMGNIVDGRNFIFVLVAIPLQIALCIIFLYALLGWAAFVALATICILFPVPGYIAKRIQSVQRVTMNKTDARVQVVTEIMNLLRMIKYFGWESKMDAKVAEKRDEELLWVWKRSVLDITNAMLNLLIPTITMLATYTTFVSNRLLKSDALLKILQTLIMKRSLNASIVFSSVTVFDMVRGQIHMGFSMVTSSIQGKVSLDRLDEFLRNTELLDIYSKKEPVADLLPDDTREAIRDSIGFCDASFAWSNDTDGTMTPSKRNFLLKIEDELLFQRGLINLIIGPTGSGKTSMLMALLGELHFIPSKPTSWYNLPREDGIAYAAQESWVLNETIKENILFGTPYDEARYQKVLYQCCLERDLSLFNAGDQTEVGEKGLTLSGGQKARITLARAIYSSAGILLLDDIFAALDVHTAKWIVEKCFAGDLIKGRTVVLVTHNVALVRPIAHFVVSLAVDGTISSRGSISDVIAHDKVLATELTKDQETLDKEEEDIASAPILDEAKDKGKLIMAEEIPVGHVSWSAVKMYIYGLGGNHIFLFFFAFLGGLVVSDIFMTFQTWFLGYWASQYENHPASEVHVLRYVGGYAALLCLGFPVHAGLWIVYVYGSLRASRTIHRRLVESILGSTFRWLDTTPTSRVIARCTEDIRAVDGPIADGFSWVAELTLVLVTKFSAVVIITPIFLFPGLVMFFIGGLCGQIYMKAQLSVKREMSNSKAPVLAHFGAAITGITSIRAYGAEKKFTLETQERIDRYSRAGRTFYNLNRWVSIRLDVITGSFLAALAAYLVYGQWESSSNIGFSLNMAVSFRNLILGWIRILNEFEVQGNSLERIQAYIHIEQEPKPTEGGAPPAYWPSSGDLRVEKLSARYSPDGPKVLDDISFHIKSGQRVGVVGRTGSGKSSLTLSLLRCIFTEGEVYYDGIPTSSLNLDALRSNITIIPQVPELLSGSLRQNLDPFSQYDDATLNAALRSAGLFSLQNEMDEGKLILDSAIASGGANLSVGQRQVLALARAIVRGSKLLILDEATSAIDYKTDAVIQSSLRNELSRDVTLFTVAHRLQTIMDADKIMVLDAGRIVEFDSPKELLKNSSGALRGLVDESEDRDVLYAMTEGTVVQVAK